MKYSKKCKLDKVISNERGRYAMDAARFTRTPKTVDGPALVVTNGRALVVLPVEESEGDAEGLIPRDALKLASKGNRHGFAEIKLGEQVSVGSNGSTTTYEPGDGEFPDHERVVPDADGLFAVALNADLLADVQDAMGSAGVRLYFNPKDPHSAIRVEPHGEWPAESVGAIMPMNLRD